MNTSNWERFKKHLLHYEELGFLLDISRMRFGDEFLAAMEPEAQRAFGAMAELEAGAIANPDEGRMVGHYWLREASLAPVALRGEIESTRRAVKEFAREVHAAGRFTEVLLVGIGGSALGPQLTTDALGGATDPMRLHFLDNTDPDGIRRVLEGLTPRRDRTLVLVISKSGGTKETRNGMLEARAWVEAGGADFARQAVAVTGVGSELDRLAEGWLRRFPMWDWVGGRTSVMSAVGLLPMALQGLDVDGFLEGAAAMDRRTRHPETARNAAMLLALMWHYAGRGRGERDMVVLPYKDRLVLLSKYLQQLVMESLGKELDTEGRVVHQGLAVYGNKGSTDQHAYVQQLREGLSNFFVTFLEIRRGGGEPALEVEPGVISADYLQGFLRGTRAALEEKGRESILVSMPEVTAYHLGALIALYERAVGFYASLVGINAYHQPGVEAGKKAAARLLELQRKVAGLLEREPVSGVEGLAQEAGADPEEVYHVLNHLAANARSGRVREVAGRLTGVAG